jgi:hypothetical protein
MEEIKVQQKAGKIIQTVCYLGITTTLGEIDMALCHLPVQFHHQEVLGQYEVTSVHRLASLFPVDQGINGICLMH